MPAPAGMTAVAGDARSAGTPNRDPIDALALENGRIFCIFFTRPGAEFTDS